MTPTQRKQLAQIPLKECEENWRVECKHYHSPLWVQPASDHTVDCSLYKYRAVRIELIPIRTPLPIEHYRRGMEVALRIGLAAIDRLVVGVDHGGIILETAELTDVKRVSKWRWPNETEWKPAYTETVEEKIVETLIVEGL